MEGCESEKLQIEGCIVVKRRNSIVVLSRAISEQHEATPTENVQNRMINHRRLNYVLNDNIARVCFGK